MRSLRLLLAVFTVAIGMVVLVGGASATSGDLVGTVTFSQDCASTLGVGIAYDGSGHLWISCYASNPDLLRASATTGVVDQTYNIEGGLGALAYDATRNALWAGPGCGSSNDVWLIKLDGTKTVTSSSAKFTPGLGGCLDDGLAYDATDDTLYYSPDGSTDIEHDHTDGTTAGATQPWTGGSCYNSGLAIGGSLLFQGSDGCGHVWVVNKSTFAPAFDFSTIVPGDANFRDEGLTCDPNTFAGLGKEVMWSKEAFSPNRAAAFEIPSGTCGIGGQPLPPVDHQLCYTASGPYYKVPARVILTNQFMPNGFQPKIKTTVSLHCNPVVKFTPNQAYEVSNPDAHLACYGMSAGQQPTHKVLVTNQFGAAALATGQPNQFCVPSWKGLTAPPKKQPTTPPNLNHFTCYPVQLIDGSYQPPSIMLKDEFSGNPVNVQVGPVPVSLCLPTDKFLPASKKDFPILNPAQHLLCYPVSKTPFKKFVFDENQFGTHKVTIRATKTLCLPSTKVVIQ